MTDQSRVEEEARDNLEEILRQWNYRAIGNSFAMIQGAKNCDALVLVHNEQYKRDLISQGIKRENILTLTSLPHSLRGCRKPLLVDHYTMGRIITQAFLARDQRIKELKQEKFDDRIELNRKITDLQEELKEWRDDQASCMAERCGDEVHCTCVPSLRREVKELQTRLSTLKEKHDCLKHNYRILDENREIGIDYATKEIDRLTIRLSTLLKASEGMEKALEQTRYWTIAVADNSQCKYTRTGANSISCELDKALADFRAVKEGK